MTDIPLLDFNDIFGDGEIVEIKREGECAYRYDRGWGDGLILTWLPILKHTRKGYWVDHYGKKKFILKDANKKFACLSKEEAQVSFIARKKRHISILEAHLCDAKDQLRLATRLFEGDSNAIQV